MSKEIAPNFSASDVSNIKKFSRRKKVLLQSVITLSHRWKTSRKTSPDFSASDHEIWPLLEGHCKFYHHLLPENSGCNFMILEWPFTPSKLNFSGNVIQAIHFLIHVGVQTLFNVDRTVKQQFFKSMFYVSLTGCV